MMTANANDHYRRAEELLTQAYDLPSGSGNELGALLAAQVHATLALAAAHGANQPPPRLSFNAKPMTEEQSRAFREAIRDLP